MSGAKTSLFYRKLLPYRCYHIYNRTNGKDWLFIDDQDHHFFLNRMKKYIHPFSSILSYNLLINHFHLQIIPFTKEKLKRRLNPMLQNEISPACLALIDSDEDNIPAIMSNRFGAAFNSYAKYFDYKYQRNGNLFNHKFCRKEVYSEKYIKGCFQYVSNNALHHNLYARPIDQPWSSYQALISHDNYLLDFSAIYEIFGSLNNAVQFIQKSRPLSKGQPFEIEAETIDKILMTEERKVA